MLINYKWNDDNNIMRMLYMQGQTLAWMEYDNVLDENKIFENKISWLKKSWIKPFEINNAESSDPIVLPYSECSSSPPFNVYHPQMENFHIQELNFKLWRLSENKIISQLDDTLCGCWMILCLVMNNLRLNN